MNNGRIFQTAGMPDEDEILRQANAIRTLNVMRPHRSMTRKRPATMVLATPQNRDRSVKTA